MRLIIDDTILVRDQWALYIYICSEIFRSPSEAKYGGPELRQFQSPYTVFHVYVLWKNCTGGQT